MNIIPDAIERINTPEFSSDIEEAYA